MAVVKGRVFFGEDPKPRILRIDDAVVYIDDDPTPYPCSSFEVTFLKPVPLAVSLFSKEPEGELEADEAASQWVRGLPEAHGEFTGYYGLPPEGIEAEGSGLE